MPFPPRSFEQIHSDITEAGHAHGFVVVPQFSLAYFDAAGRRRRKKPDIVWLFAQNGHAANDIPPHRVVAAFEIEGFNVPLTTIDLHSKVYPRIRVALGAEVPCYVPIYSRAAHRARYGRNVEVVQQKFLERLNRAAQHQHAIEVCDGMTRDWLARAREVAGRLAQG